MLATNAGTFFKSSEECFDIVGNLLRGDYEHRDCEGKGCINKSFQSRHGDAPQPEPGESRQ